MTDGQSSLLLLIILGAVLVYKIISALFAYQERQDAQRLKLRELELAHLERQAIHSGLAKLYESYTMLLKRFF